MADDCFIPGTVHLVDIEGTLRAKHASGGQNDIVLIPAPSDDPDDPLNWSAKRKMTSTASVSLYVYHLLFYQSLRLLEQIYILDRYRFRSHIFDPRTYSRKHRLDSERP